MKTNKTQRRRSLAIALILCVCAVLALGAPRTLWATDFGGFSFDDTISLGGTELQLNGVGLRSVFILKAFLAALYVPRRSSDALDLLRQVGPKRLQMKMLVDMSPERMIKTLTSALSDNSADAEVTFKAQIDQLEAVLRTMGTAKKGDTVDLDLIDGATRVALNGQPRGSPVAGEDFFTALLRGFVGDKPLEKSLKKGLLGG